MDQTYNELEELPIRIRTAFAAACAERALVIYELTCDTYHPVVQQAVDAAWALAEGKEVDPERIETIDSEFEEALPDLDWEGSDAELASGVAASVALETANDETSKSARQTALSVLDAVDGIDNYSGKGVAEELAWQEKAIEILRSWGQQPVYREMFNDLNKEKPEWLVGFDETAVWPFGK